MYPVCHDKSSQGVDLSVHSAYSLGMNNKDAKLQIRVSESEKKGFQTAADLAGIPLSSWVRERLRLAAIRDLESAGFKIPFVAPVHLKAPDA